MPMSALEDDLATFTSSQDFGTVATIQFAAGGTSQVPGIFDNEDVPTENAVSEFIGDTFVNQIRFHCASSDVLTIQPNDVVTINSTDYYLAYVSKDGTGMTMLYLSDEVL